MPLDIEKIHRHFTILEDDRQPWENLWRATAQFYLPTSMYWEEGLTIRGGRLRGQRVYDDTPSWAASRFAASMLGMLTNPSQKWLEFELHTDTRSNLSLSAQSWLGDLRDRVLMLLQLPDVGFYDAMHEHLLDYGIFGEAIMLIDRNPETDLPRFTPYPLEQCYTGVGPNRRVNTVFRKWTMTAQDIKDTFEGDGPLPDLILKALEDKQYLTKFTVIHGVFPRKHGVAGGFATNKPWASVYYLERNKTLLRESGFDLFPFSTPRFMLFAGQNHGQGPGTLSLSNVKSLNTIIKTLLTSDQRTAAPAYLAQRRGWVKPLKMNPWHINYYDGFDMDKALIPIGNEGQPQAGQEWVQMYQEQILRAFYLDRLITPQKAAEVKEVEALVREEEKMRDLTPQLSRLHAECISMVVANVVLMASETMEPPPPELANQMIKIRYMSPLARAQNMLEVSNANRTVQQILLPIMQIDESVSQALDWYKFASWALDHSNFPSDIRKTEEEYNDSMAQSQQQNEMAMALEAGQGASEIAKNVSQAQAASSQSPLGGFF